jgi:hypothetical protein
MTKHVRIILALIGLTMLQGASSVSADSLRMRIRIPFEFTAGKATLPPGTYFLNRVDGSEGMFLLRGPTRGLYLVSHRAKSGHTTNGSCLVFNRYGDRHFLRELWFSSNDGYPLREGRVERELVKALAGRESHGRVTVTGGGR